MKVRLILILFIQLLFLFSSKASTISTKNDYRTNFEKAENYKINYSYDTAIYYYNQALKGIEEDTIKAKVFLRRGKTYQNKKSYDKALIDYNEALSIYKENKNSNGVIETYVYLAEFNRHLGKLQKAFKYIDIAEQLIRKFPVEKKILANFYNRKAAVLAENGSSSEEVISISKKCLAISEKLGYDELSAASYNEIAFRLQHLKDTSAITYYLKALNLYEKLGDIRSQSHVISNIARFYQVNEKYEDCIKYCDLGLELTKDTDWYLDIKDFYHLKSACLHFLGRFKEAYLISLDRLHAAVEYNNEMANKQLEELETKYEVEKKDEQIKIQKLNTQQAKEKATERLTQIKYTIIIIILLALFLIVSLYAYFKIKKSNKLLNQSIEEKEILLQEVHHRVKNNLTVLNSLLYIQADESNDKETKRILKESQGRIQSMALVHQNLYDVDDASEVNLNLFLKELIYESLEIFGVQNLKISKTIETNSIHFDMSFTVFLGLILNELITNSFKYAFSEEEENKMKIELFKERDTFVLTYWDSGKGLPDGFDFKKSSGFGFKLIQIMLNQIRGTVNYSKKDNSFVIKFQKLKNK